MCKKANIGVIGGGAWGTTIAKLLSEKNSNVQLWAKETHVKKNIENAINQVGCATVEQIAFPCRS